MHIKHNRGLAVLCSVRGNLGARCRCPRGDWMGTEYPYCGVHCHDPGPLAAEGVMNPWWWAIVARANLSGVAPLREC
jgi:hypothetical protein